MRHICYISGTRADFGLMEATLRGIVAAPDLQLSVIATGMHLDKAYGHTIDEIVSAGFNIAATLPVPLNPPTGATMARNIGTMVAGFVDSMERQRPDIVLLLGDRGEMLAGAIAALHLNIPIAHVAGGDRSGTVDEPVRHAISKLSHIHFAATPGARERLIRMGEDAEHVFVTGAPGLDGLVDTLVPDRNVLVRTYGLDPARPFALMVFHPVLQEAEQAFGDTRLLLRCLKEAGFQVLALMPNSDAGSRGVRDALGVAAADADVKVETHLPREAFIAAMARADVMVGNSSAGIVEAASFGTPVLNLGRRQNLRERNANVRDAACLENEIMDALNEILRDGRLPPANIYGDGRAAQRIVHHLAALPLEPSLLQKTNSY